MAKINFLNAQELISWLKSISEMDKDPTIRSAANELADKVDGNLQIIQKSYYDKLYRKYKFKLNSVKEGDSIKPVLYSYENGQEKLVGIVQKTVIPRRTIEIVPEMSVTPSLSPSLTPTLTSNLSPSFTPTKTITATLSKTPNVTKTPTLTPSVTPKITKTPTVTPTVTKTPSKTPSVTETLTPTLTQTVTLTPTITKSPKEPAGRPDPPSPTPSVTPICLLTNLTAYYSFDNQNGNDTVCTYNLYRTGGDFSFKSKSGGYSFDTFNSGYLHENNPPSYFNFSNKSFTISFWFKPSGDPIKTQTLIGWQDLGTGAGLSIGLIFSLNNEYQVEFRMLGGSATSIVSPVIILHNAGEWTHIVARFDVDSGEMNLDVNNINTTLNYQFALNIPPSSNPILRIGRGYDQSDCSIDEVAIWYRSLSNSDVYNLYNNGDGRFYEDFICGITQPCIIPTPSVTVTPTLTPSYYYYTVRNCNTAEDFVGRSTISGLYNEYYPNVINLSTGICLEVIGPASGVSYDYDLDTRLGIVNSCLDPVCQVPVPSVTPTVTVTPSITTTPDYTLNTRQLYPNIKLYSYAYASPRPVNVYVAEIDLTGNIGCKITGPQNKGTRETYRTTTKKFVEDNNGQIGMNLHFFTHVSDPSLTTYLLGLGVSDSTIISNFENQPGPELDQSYAILGYAPGINIDSNNVASVVTRNPNYPGPGQSPVNESVTLKNTFAGSSQVITNGVKTIPTYYTGGGPYPYGSSYLNPISPPGGGPVYNNGNSWYDLTRSRAIIGISDDGTKMYLAVGEYVTSTGYGGIKVGELSDILIKEHGVYNAINMDGGSSVGLVYKDPADGIVKYINNPEAGDPREVGSNITFWNIPPSPGVTPTPSETPSITPSVTPPNGSIAATPSYTPTLTPSLTTAPPLQKFQVVYSLVGAVETGSAIISTRLTGSLLTGPGGPAAEPGRLISYVLTTDPSNPKEGAPNRQMFGVKRNNSYLNGNKGSFISASITSLLPGTTYYYWIYDHNNDRYISESTERKVTTTPFKNLVGPYTYLGKFKTSPLTSSAYRFSASYAACVTSYSTIPLYYHVKLYNPDLFIHLGDMHYFDNAQEPRTPREYESAWQTVFASGSGYQAKLGQESTWSRPNYMPLLIRDTSFEYMWDDHDYGPNDSFGTTTGPNSNPSKAHAQTVYSLIFPHYKLPSTPYTYLSGSNNVAVSSQAIYHSFKKGRIKFIATDNRSEASNYTDPESDSKRIWSQEQEDWFKSEMTDTSCPVKVWICSYPWSGKDDTSPRWSGFSTYRKKIANFFTANSSSIGKIIILSGDAHMTAMDDGYYSEWYGTGSKVNPPISTHQSAPIDRTGGGFEGGPYILYGADFISPTTTSSLKDLTVNGANYSKAVDGLSSSYTIMNNRYGCMEVYDDLSNIEISMYSRSGTAKVSSLGGDYRMPIVNHKYSKWKLTLNTTNFNKDTGGKITETISFVDVHQKP